MECTHPVPKTQSPFQATNGRAHALAQTMALHDEHIRERGRYFAYLAAEPLASPLATPVEKAAAALKTTPHWVRLWLRQRGLSVDAFADHRALIEAIQEKASVERVEGGDWHVIYDGQG